MSVNIDPLEEKGVRPHLGRHPLILPTIARGVVRVFDGLTLASAGASKIPTTCLPRLLYSNEHEKPNGPSARAPLEVLLARVL